MELPQPEDILGIYRTYAGDDGESHIEEVDITQYPGLDNLVPLQGLRLRQPTPQQYPPNDPRAFHNAPQRQWVAIVQGRATVGLGDGSSHDFHQGDMVLFEDVTGHGHTINWPEPSILCVMPLLNQ